jgi:hypothetical protein
MWYILDENNNPIKADPLTASNFKYDNHGKTKRAIVRQTSIRNYWISTVFLGLDHGYNLTGRKDYQPVLFETMIQKDEVFMDYQERYYTWKEAQQGHRETVRVVIKEIRNIINKKEKS